MEEIKNILEQKNLIFFSQIALSVKTAFFNTNLYPQNLGKRDNNNITKQYIVHVSYSLKSHFLDHLMGVIPLNKLAKNVSFLLFFEAISFNS